MCQCTVIYQILTMMWKTLIFLAAASVVLAGRIKKHKTNYEFYVKHDYDYGHRHKLDHHEHVEEKEHHEEKDEAKHHEEKDVIEENNSNEEQPKEEEQTEEKKEDEPNEEQQEKQEENIETQKPENHEEDEYPAYEFLYKVKDHYTHDIKGQHEKKYGDEVMGAYWLLQPDGYKRTVKYHANNHNGFLAKVDYSKPEENDVEQHEPEHKYDHYLKIYHDYKTHDKENKEENHEHIPPSSEYFVKTYHGLKKSIPIKEEVEEEETQEKQGDSAQHIPIYVI